MNENRLRICILGGGFGGLYTALRLSQLPWETNQAPEIILIDQQDRFLFAPFLYELVTGEMQTWEIAPPFEELLAETGVRFHQGQVTAIAIEEKQVHLEPSVSLGYDKLVIAMGGKTSLPTVPGVRDYALPFRNLEDAYRLKERLRLLEQSPAEKIRIAIVGGGYSGVELACKLGDRLGERGRLRLIERGDTILKLSPEYNRKTAQDALADRGIWLDLETDITEITSDSLSLRYKGQIDTIPVDIVLWTVGNDVSELIRDLPLPHDKNGLLETNHFLQVIDHPDVYALGDVAACEDATGQHLPATAQVAFQQSDYCAWNIWAGETNRPPLPFRYQALGEMLTLGIDNATINGLGIKLNGTPAAIARRLIYLYRLPTWQHQLTVGFNWLTQPLLELFKG
ncbi:MAG: FAD-dependent oxidoreductase [Snowella sp.]|jgi:NADH dehydrogenase|nr:MAG: FAD-dependent oxidoreductase [Snowella sp.]